MAVGKKTGGRKKGSRNKVTAEREREVAASGLTPLDYMLKVLRDEDVSETRRDWAAEKAAPFCHSRLSSIEADVRLTGHEAALDELE